MMFHTLRRRVALAIYPDLGTSTGAPTDRGPVPLDQWAGQVCAAMPRAAGAHQPFIALEELDECLAALRHGRIERAKQILQIVQSVQLHGLPGRDDPAFDVLSEEFAVLLFGKK